MSNLKKDYIRGLEKAKSILANSNGWFDVVLIQHLEKRLKDLKYNRATLDNKEQE